MYLEDSKWYVMYWEHLIGGMTEMNSYNVDFLEDEFPSIGKIEKDLELYELQHRLQPSLVEWEDLNSHKSPKIPHYLIGTREVCLFREMRFVLNLQPLRRFGLGMRFILNPLALNM